MLFVSRKHLTPITDAIQDAVFTFVDSAGLRVMLRPTPEQIEAATMLGLSALVSMELGRHDVVWPGDVQVLSTRNGETVAVLTPPDLQKFD